MTWLTFRIDVELDGHQAAGFIADRAGPVAFLAVGFGAALILSEREFARPLLYRVLFMFR